MGFPRLRKQIFRPAPDCLSEASRRRCGDYGNADWLNKFFVGASIADRPAIECCHWLTRELISSLALGTLLVPQHWGSLASFTGDLISSPIP